MRRLAIRLLLAGPCLVPAFGRAAPPETETPPDGEVELERKRATAKRAAKAGAVAFREGDYQTALRHFEDASALLPSPKLHYNIAVCHHRLMMSAEDDASRIAHADQAIDAYNRYLEAKPDATDRHEVAEIVRGLGGTPATRTGLKSAFEAVDDVVEEDDELGLPADKAEGDAGTKGETEDGDAPPTESAPEESLPDPVVPTERYHARFYFGPHIGMSPQQLGNQDVAGALALMAEGKAGGYLGQRRRILLGAEFAFWAQAGTGQKLTFSSGHLAAALDYEFHVGQRHRAIVSLGGMGGYSRQAIRTTQTAAAPICSQGQEEGKLVAARNGGVIGARFRVGVLLGQRRWHELDFSVHPLVGIYGDGGRGTDCEGAPSPHPFVNLGVPSRLVSIFSGFGYAFRF